MSTGQAAEKPSSEKYGVHLTQRAREGKLDPVTSREASIRRLVQINNPVLTGSAGVGEPAIIEGLAHSIVQRDVPESMQSKLVVRLDLS